MIFNFLKRKKDEQARLKQEILAFGFNNPKALIDLIQPAILITESTGDCPLASSKFGGQPDLPEHIHWPAFEDEAMVFIGQLNVSEINRLQSGLELPNAGLLSFFIHFSAPENEFGANYDFKPEEKHYKVMYFDKTDHLMRKDFPSKLFSEYRFPESRMSFTQDFQVPATSESSFILNSNLDEGDKDLIFDFAHRYDDGFMDQIGGYPVPIQQGVDLDWAYSHAENTESRYEKSLQLGQDYVNLFSFSLGFNFEVIGDSTCYFGITIENLKAMRFDETVLVLQDT